MALPSEVQKTIRSINKKIEELEEMKRRLTETFGGTTPAPAGTQVTPQQPVIVRRGASLAEAAGVPTNVQRFEEFLREHGPSTSAAISEGASIPRGSITWIMRRSNGRIRRREDGLIELAS
jgi:hypothetical protein